MQARHAELDAAHGVERSSHEVRAPLESLLSQAGNQSMGALARTMNSTLHRATDPAAASSPPVLEQTGNKPATLADLELIREAGQYVQQCDGLCSAYNRSLDRVEARLAELEQTLQAADEGSWSPKSSDQAFAAVEAEAARLEQLGRQASEMAAAEGPAPMAERLTQRLAQLRADAASEVDVQKVTPEDVAAMQERIDVAIRDVERVGVNVGRVKATAEPLAQELRLGAGEMSIATPPRLDARAGTVGPGWSASPPVPVRGSTGGGPVPAPKSVRLRFLQAVGKLLGVTGNALSVGLQIVQVFKVAEEIKWIATRNEDAPVGTEHTDFYGCTWKKVNAERNEWHSDGYCVPLLSGGDEVL